MKLVDPNDKQATDIVWRYTEDGKQVRVSVRTGRIIPIPKTAFETMDYKSKEAYVDRAKDTTSAELSKITFVPVLGTFEMDIMGQHDITDDRVPHRTFWY